MEKVVVVGYSDMVTEKEAEDDDVGVDLVPIIDSIRQLKDVLDVDPNQDVHELYPLYQRDVLIAWRRVIYQAPGETGVWGPQRLVVPATTSPKVEDVQEYFPE